MEFFVSASTDKGIKRSINQDHLFVRKIETRTGEMAFAVLCDGMGGLQHGEVASASIISAFTEWMYTYLPELSKEPIRDHVIREQWGTVISDVNRNLYQFGMDRHCKVGSTVTALLLTQYRYFLLNIGDTRAYEIGSAVRKMTVDHTVAAKEVALGNMTEAQAQELPASHVLTRCVGVSEKTYPDMFFGDTKANTTYMLCSDGFRHHLTEQEMRECLFERVRVRADVVKQQEEYLIDLVKRRGETDNISVVTIFVR